MKAISIFMFSFWCGLTSIYAQGLNINRFFRTGLNLRTEYIPNTTFRDSTSAQANITRHSAQLIIPIKGKIKASITKLDITANQYFLTLNGSYRQINTTLQGVTTPQRLYTASFAFAGLHAGIRSKMWLYAFGGGITESAQTLGKSRPYGTGALLRVKIKGLNTQKFYGFAVVNSNPGFIPAPIWGINKKIAKKTTMTLILPVQAQVTYKFSKKHNLAFLITPGGLAGGVRDTILLKTTKERLRYNYSHIKTSFTWNWAISSNAKLSLEAGVVFNRSLALAYMPSKKTDAPFSQHLKPAPIVSLNIYTNLTNKFLDSGSFGFEF